MEVGLIIITDYCINIVSQQVSKDYPLSVTQVSPEETYFAQDSEDRCLIHFGHTHREFLVGTDPHNLPNQLRQFSDFIAFILNDFLQQCERDKAQQPTHIAACISCHFAGTTLSFIATAIRQLALPLLGIFHTESTAAAPLTPGTYLFLSLNKHSIRATAVEKAKNNVVNVLEEEQQIAWGFDQVVDDMIKFINQKLITAHKINVKKSIDLEQKVYSAVAHFWFEGGENNLPLTLTIDNADIELTHQEVLSIATEPQLHIEAIRLNQYDGIIIDNALKHIILMNDSTPQRYFSGLDCFANLIDSQTFPALVKQFSYDQAPSLIRSIQSEVNNHYRLEARHSYHFQPTHLLINTELYTLSLLRRQHDITYYLFLAPPYLAKSIDSSKTKPIAYLRVSVRGIEITPYDRDGDNGSFSSTLIENASQTVEIEGLALKALTEINTL